MQTLVPEPQMVAATRPHHRPIIEVKNLVKQFGKNDPTIKDVSFEVRAGQIFCLLGPSGSGKSTILRMLTGVYRPSEGQVRVFGIEPHRFRSQTRSRIGYMPQQFLLFPELSTIENLHFVASVYGVSWFGRKEKVRKALEFVDLWDARNKLATNLSGGMQRRLELATVLVHQPELIFVDEPTAGIDPVLRAKFWEHFKTLRDEGRTIFVTTQYVTEADYCDEVAILNAGRLIAIGTPEDVRTEAFGGEIINLTLDEITSESVRLLRQISSMRRIKSLSPESLRLTVENASEALQEIVTVFQEHNINIESIEPYKPNFEEVFVQLMEQDNAKTEKQNQENQTQAKDNKNAKAKIVGGAK